MDSLCPTGWGIIGTVASGFIIQDSTLKSGHRYGVALLLEAFFLFLAIPLLKHQSLSGIYCLACACGLQNAMVTTFSGTVVRTTHLSGMFTDLGIFLGHSLRGLPIDVKRMRMSFLIISGFLCGGIAGAIFYRTWEFSSLAVPAVMITVAAIGYEFYQFRHPGNIQP